MIQDRLDWHSLDGLVRVFVSIEFIYTVFILILVLNLNIFTIHYGFMMNESMKIKWCKNLLGVYLIASLDV